MPANGSKPVHYEQSLDGSFADFSLACDRCTGVRTLIFTGGGVEVAVILSDHVLSVLHLKQESEAGQAKLTQVCPIYSIHVHVHVHAYNVA